MLKIVQSTCPGCRRTLTIPVDYLNQPFRCLHCKAVMYSAGQLPNAGVKPLVEAMPEYVPSVNTSARTATGKAYRKKSSNQIGKYLAFGVVTFGVLGLGMVFLLKPNLLRDKIESIDGTKQVAVNPADGKPGTPAKGIVKKIDVTKAGPVVTVGNFPRRVLAIGVSNYLYANPLSDGVTAAGRESERRDFYKNVERLANGWQVSKDQLYAVCDSQTTQLNKIDEKHPPLKNVIVETIERFCDSSREQDRIVIFYSGHAVMLDGEAYLASQEGELDEAKTLIPLKEVYAKLAACPAQEKVIIFDVCRYNPGQGVERPSSGMMNAELETAFHTPPDGIAVWTSCSKDEYAYEYDNFYSEATMRNMFFSGSVFMNMFNPASLKGKFSPKADGTGIHQPSDPLPLKHLVQYVSDTTKAMAQDLEKKPQTPKFTLKGTPKQVAFNAQEPMPAKFDLPDPPKGADQKEVLALFGDLKLPPIKSTTRLNVSESRLANSFPFTAEKLAVYKDGSESKDEMLKDPKKFGLRLAVLDAVEQMRKMNQEGKEVELPEEFRGQTGDEAKKRILAIQRVPAERQATLQDLRDNLDQFAKDRDKEPKRWQAHYDYVKAEVLLRYAYINEYNLALGKVRKDELPELDMKLDQKGWKLAAVEKMISPSDIRKLADEAKTLLADLAKDNEGTPWALLAKRDKSVALGLQWQASAFDNGR